jgi:hypothetical protein
VDVSAPQVLPIWTYGLAPIVHPLKWIFADAQKELQKQVLGLE